MPTPSSSQATINTGMECAQPSSASPAANVRLEADSTCRPPTRSICRPTRGPSRAAITSEAEKAANIQLLETPRSCAIGSARMAGK